ncbi:uncharacterized protein [Elaeis guineensis]|uniref:uncharacterized protein isoform X3 n=1 Tax=Elaeis guineensis var. tenera TaxID=51953 RepID=UPI003C6D33D1
MSMNRADEVDYMTDESEMGNAMDDEMEGDFFDADRGRGEADDEYDLLTRVTDTSSAQARSGRDIQGIPWDRLQITRQNYRQTRIQQYKNYENIPSSGDRMNKKCKQVEKGGNYYEFQYNTRLVKPTILHFQLRNLVWATSKHDVYFMSNSSVMHWSSICSSLSEVLDFSGHVAPGELKNILLVGFQKYPGSLLDGFTRTQISTLAVKDGLMVAGGFQGELTCKLLERQGVSFCTRTTFDDNAITNAIDIYKDSSGGIRFMASNNDCGVRDYDVETFQLLNHFQFPWSVNHTSISPDGKLVVVVGDDRDGSLVDSRNGKFGPSVTPPMGSSCCSPSLLTSYTSIAPGLTTRSGKSWTFLGRYQVFR